MTDWAPHSRYPHLFVVVRCAADATATGRVEDGISLVAAFSSREDAETEAARLTELNGEKGDAYVVMVTRLKDPA